MSLSPETPIQNLPVSNELLSFAFEHAFENMKEMLVPGLNVLHQFEGFNYRLQHEIINLVQDNHWENLLDLY